MHLATEWSSKDWSSLWHVLVLSTDKILPLLSSSKFDCIITERKKSFCHSNPLKHPQETEAVWLGPLCSTTPQPPYKRQICRQKSDLCPKIRNLSYVLPAVFSISHYLLPRSVISGLSSYLKSTNKGAQTELTILLKVFRNAVFVRVKKQSQQIFHLLFIWLTAKELWNWKLKFGQPRESNSNANTSSLVQRQWNSTHGHQITTKKSLKEVSEQTNNWATWFKTSCQRLQ